MIVTDLDSNSSAGIPNESASEAGTIIACLTQ